jgi:sugar lactone lactonase YvrE
VYEVLDDLIIANGPAFTADGSTMFLADSGRATLTRFRITDDGTPTEPFVLLREESCAVPDGLTTDATGAVWVAMWGAAEIRRYSPEGNLLTRIALPAAQPTSVALHGNRALVTTARLGLEQPTKYDGLLLSAALATEPGAAVSLPPRFFG